MPEPIKGDGRCPKCASRKTARAEQPVTAFYSRTLEVCGNCGAAWEPIDRTLIWDPDDPYCSFSKPCDNCAFRPGSAEQQDVEKWKETIASLKAGGQFFCHKGVPLDLTPEGDGFAYPRDAKGDVIVRKMRLCRGYLNMLKRLWDREAKSGSETAILAEETARG